MSAAVVSGAVALLLEANPRLTPAQVKLALQVTSSRVAGAGLIEAGAGSVNVVAAVGLVTGNAGFRTTTIAGATSTIGGLTYCANGSQCRVASHRLPHALLQFI